MISPYIRYKVVMSSQEGVVLPEAPGPPSAPTAASPAALLTTSSNPGFETRHSLQASLLPTVSVSRNITNVSGKARPVVARNAEAGSCCFGRRGSCSRQTSLSSSCSCVLLPLLRF